MACNLFPAQQFHTSCHSSNISLYEDTCLWQEASYEIQCTIRQKQSKDSQTAKNDHWCTNRHTRYDSGYLTCSKKLTGSQLSLPHKTNKKLKCETKNKMMSVIGPVQSRYREAVQ